MKKTMRKIGVAAAVAVAWAPLLVWAYPQPLLEYKFNVNDNNLATNTGYYATQALYMFNRLGSAANLQTASGIGVSGQPGDQAFNNGALDMGNISPNGGFADQRAYYTEYENRNALTIACWFNAQTQMMRNAGLITKISGNYGWSFDVMTGTGTQPLRLILGSGSAQLVSYGTTNGTVTGGSLFGETGTWVFCAATWDGTLGANNVIWYKGTKTSSVVPVYTGTIALAQIAQGSAFLTVGTMNGSQTNRCFYGLLDNVRLWMSTGTNSAVIGQEGLEAYRTADLVPEPGMLLGVGVLALAVLRRRG